MALISTHTFSCTGFQVIYSLSNNKMKGSLYSEQHQVHSNISYFLWVNLQLRYPGDTEYRIVGISIGFYKILDLPQFCLQVNYPNAPYQGVCFIQGGTELDLYSASVFRPFLSSKDSKDTGQFNWARYQICICKEITSTLALLPMTIVSERLYSQEKTAKSCTS